MTAKECNLPFEEWSVAVGAPSHEIKAAWDDLHRRGLVSEKDNREEVSAWAMRRADNHVQRRLAAHLAGYQLTENSFIVCRTGEPSGSPSILNTRVTVEHIANCFNDGIGVPDIQRDLPQLTREEIEAAIQYYLNHRNEIDADMRRSHEMFDANSPAQEVASS